ncbi:hypothetical protein ACEWY4_024670 [Coilia grayii]|uniref:C-type lectin domain-containing protein n=1 Tax=Coilia grayii TaxID=363190 RepID=A0ABD1IVE8_9TELE
MAEMERLYRTIQEAGAGEAWIGLKHGSSPKWQWSLADRDFYRENEAEFRNWDTSWVNHDMCVITGTNYKHPYVLVSPAKNWTDAQRYCREKHTDLASVRNQTENEQIGASGNVHAWIGLFRDAWEWSDGSSSSFRHWGPGEPDYAAPNQHGFCVEVKSSGLWNNHQCNESRNFICYGVIKTQIMRLKLQVASHVDLDDPDVQAAFLQQIGQRLKDKGLPTDDKLTWRKQPDGKVFQKEENGKKKEKRDGL